MEEDVHKSRISQIDAPKPVEELLADYQPRIYFFIRSMVFNPDDARDILQDVNVIIWRKRDQFTPASDFKSWAFAIARFECLNYLHRHKKSPLLPMAQDLLEELAHKAEDRSGEVDMWIISLEKCRSLLLEEARQLLDLRYRQRIPLETVATQWKTSIGALKQKLLRARIQLKDCILKHRSEEMDKNP